ncbi:glycosyltransferase family 2 protein [Motilibacter deserti]|uniref:Glycosyltransferase family 2 protein n=1 Tax=Motilibacter deserti TaxID=2714956 RepID=A0ABX0GW48_9ACTN|nr:glycosyltransferase family 2 protein [Motilibacter deserti]NHC15161.1 glycosyltransferase family 2 protein [Motilibacter deserti]
MSVKVSVVVPVYNPGSHIDDCIRSLLEQSLPTDEYEAIFVDDGSTDETPARLDALAAEHDHVRVFHIPNSGWPGRPRNVGIDNARGEFVYFVDNDDWLGPEALERLYAYAVEHGSDVVIGKLVGHRRGIPKEIFRRSKPKAVLGQDPLLTLLTPHKLFRKAMLDKHEIRFPEGRRRLEDHLFVMKAYFAADTISILADYPVYHWVRRDDDTNASVNRFDPKGYFDNVREVLDVVVANTEPGDLRDKLLAHWYTGKSLGRLGAGTLLGYPPDYRRELYDAIRGLALERFAPSVDRFLPPSFRPRSVLLRAGSLAGLEALAGAERGLTIEPTTSEVAWDGDVLQVRASARLVYADGRPVVFVRREGRLLWELPVRLDVPVPDDALDMTSALAAARADVLVRSRELRDDYFVPGAWTASLEEIDADRVSLVVAVEARLDAQTAAAGAPLAKGTWDVLVRVAACGWGPGARLSAASAPGLGALEVGESGPDRRPVSPYWTVNGNLSIAVGTRRAPAPPPPPSAPAPRPLPAPPARGRAAWLPAPVRRRLRGLARRLG